MQEIDEITEGNQGEVTNIIIPLDDMDRSEFIDEIAEKVVSKLKSNKLINNQKIYNNNTKEKEKGKKKKIQYHFALVKKIITQSKKDYATTSDIIQHEELGKNYNQSTEAIRFMNKMDREDEDVTKFKMNPNNPRSPWIMCKSKNEKKLKQMFKNKRKRRKRRN